MLHSSCSAVCSHQWCWRISDCCCASPAVAHFTFSVYPVALLIASACCAGETHGIAYLDVSYNMLGGPLPAHWGYSLPQLEELYLQGNQLLGTLPSQVCIPVCQCQCNNRGLVACTMHSQALYLLQWRVGA